MTAWVGSRLPCTEALPGAVTESARPSGATTTLSWTRSAGRSTCGGRKTDAAEFTADASGYVAAMKMTPPRCPGLADVTGSFVVAPLLQMRLGEISGPWEGSTKM